METNPHRCSSLRLSNSCTVEYGGRRAAPATPGVRLSSGTRAPTRWMGTLPHWWLTRYAEPLTAMPPAGAVGSRP